MEAKRTKYIESLDESFSDEHDIQKHILDIHALKDADVLSKDLVLAKLSDEDKKFIRNQLQLAFEAKTLIKDPKWAKYAADILLLDVNAIAILNRNTANNHLIKLVSKEHVMPEEPQSQEIDQKILDKISKKKPE